MYKEQIHRLHYNISEIHFALKHKVSLSLVKQNKKAAKIKSFFALVAVLQYIVVVVVVVIVLMVVVVATAAAKEAFSNVFQH